MRIDAIPAGYNPPHDVNVIIEVPVGGQPVIYEMDKEAGALVVDRILYTAMRYPGNYGFVPHTLSDDGDPVDILIANQRPIIPGSVMNCRPIGVLNMVDEEGHDEKIIVVPGGRVSAMYENVNNYRDLPAMMLRQIEHFFQHYKDLEDGKWVKIDHWGDEAEAREKILQSIDRHDAAKGDAKT